MNHKLTDSGIYAFFNMVNGKCYVGSAISLATRFRSHITRLRTGTHKNEHFQSAWNKYGEESFTWVLLEPVEDKSKLVKREAEWIASFEQVYNKATAGSGYGVIPTKEKRERISTALKKKYAEDPEYKKSQSEMLSRISNTPEERKRRSEYRKKKWEDPEYRAKIIAASEGKERTAEARANMSAAQKERFTDPEQLLKNREQFKVASEIRWRRVREQNELARIQLAQDKPPVPKALKLK